MIQHTIDWYNGEIFEAKFIAGFGIALIVIAFLFNFLGIHRVPRLFFIL